MRYYIADPHYYHAGLNDRMDKRGFSSLEDMHEYMISQWNSRVRRNDEVVILGDLSVGRAEETNEIVKRLNGRLYWILGNHDSKLAGNSKLDKSRFRWIKDYAEMNDNGRKVVLCHYPILFYNGQFRRDENDNAKVWMLHGHTHITEDQTQLERFKDEVRKYPRRTRQSDTPIPAPVQIINCFCMFSDYVPLTLDEWIELENTGKTREMLTGDWFYDK